MYSRTAHLLTLSYLVLASGALCPAQTLHVQHAMFQDPEFRFVPDVLRFDPQLKTTWLQALRREESEPRRLAADTLALAKQRGMTGLEETSGDLMRVLEASAGDLQVQRAVARALVILDARQAADLLSARARDNGLEFARLVEPALGRWEHEPTIREWRRRLENPATPRLKLQLAINGVAVVADQASSEPLRRLITDARQPPQIRLLAARSLGQIHGSGLVPLARELAARQQQPLSLHRMMASQLLARHEDAQSIALLRELAVDAEAAVAGAALGRLFEIDPELILDLAPQAVQRGDVNIRRLAARALFEKADGKSVRLLAPLLDDHNPALRQDVAAWLFELAAIDELTELVLSEATQMMAGDRWRGIEQAALILAYLDHKPAAARCLELLEHQRPEVFVTVAWALTVYQLPETLPVIFERAQKSLALMDALALEREPLAEFEQTAHFLQLFGLMRYEETDALLRKFVPKNYDRGEISRAAAIWSLGYLHEGQAPEELSQELAARLLDMDMVVPEFATVRRESAVSLGRMLSRSQLPALREGSTMGVNEPTGHACYWAIEQITGEPVPEAIAQLYTPINWFLVPLPR